ncbi:hypothetical protein BCR33DRAFT_849789 [Rhizoclosmatium globosum]|uniref:DUF7703 domain-containing protein n=1 Tax=Rhizoclosmatium globosum TaxID=329046 RepID=A0A1Y2CF39_9FUNG|nr:hypothetical protein BCR33DRAFT_849789 [Rhizoclosmatium globosum]|eukprot:ORY45517.1 hypothetical protein BCR33DRAFT_849789 [Rhizoclosmatium globosum]
MNDTVPSQPPPPQVAHVDISSAFQIATAAIAVYNALEIFLIVLNRFKRRDSLYFWSLVATSLGIILFAIGFLDLFFDWYLSGVKILSHLSILTVTPPDPPRPQQHSNSNPLFIIYNILFSHFPTTVFTFGANVIKTPFWKQGYDIIEKVQMTMFCIQEVSLGIIYLIYIRVRLGDETADVVQHTLIANFVVLILDISMLVTEYVGLYVYQIMLKVLVYSIKLKFEFYILTVLETNIRLSVGPTELDSAIIRARENAKAAEVRLSAMDISGGTGLQKALLRGVKVERNEEVRKFQNRAR